MIPETVADLSVLARVVLATAPTGIVATPVSASQINLTWIPVVGAVFYRVYRNGTLVETTAGTSHSSTSLAATTQYSFQLSSVGADDQEGPSSSVVTATTFAAPDLTAPTVPVISVATNSATVQIVTLVTPSTDAGSGVASYTLDRATNSGFTANLVSVSLPTNAFPRNITGLAAATQYFYRLRAVDGASNQSANSTTVNATTSSSGNQAPTWVASADQSPIPINLPFSVNLDTLCTDPEGAAVTYTILSGTLPTGLVQSGTRGQIISGTPTSAGSVAVNFRANDSTNSADADWATEGSAGANLQAQNFNSTQFPTRGDLMDYLLSIEDDCPSNGVKNAYTGVAFGGSQSERYMDPIPGGEEEKISLDTSIYLTGGQSVYMRLRSSEGATEAGPIIELPILNPSPVYYVRLVYRIDQAVLNHSYDSSHRKFCFLNHLDFTGGQIVGVLYLDHEPWPLAYRVDSATRQLRVFHSGGVYGSNYQLFGGYDTNPGGAAPATTSAWDQRFGPSFDNPSASDSDFAAVSRPLGDDWYQTEWMIDQSFVGSVSRGMFKSWGGAVGVAPQLQQLNFRDCGFANPSTMQAQSIRLTFRPEDSTSGNPSTAGIHFDSVIIRPTPIPFIGGFALPSSGQTIPSGQPVSGTSDD